MALAAGAFMYGYVVAGLLIIVVSIALVVNAEAHRKRRDGVANNADREP